MRRERPGWALLLLLLLAAPGCGGGTTTTPDTGDVAEDRTDGADVEDVDGGNPDVDGGDADAADDGADVEDVPDVPDALDVPDDGDADVPEASKRSVLVVTAGGGTARGGSYGLTLSIGTPQPMGTGSSAGFHSAVGPGAVLGQ